jgi:hypothetical protein
MNIRLELVLMTITLATLGCLVWMSGVMDAKQDYKPLCICPSPPSTPKERYVDPARHEWVEEVMRESLKHL